MANLIRGISENGGAVICAIDATDLVAKMESTHKTTAVASAALGRLITGAALMGSMLKSENNTVSLRATGDGPAGTVFAQANGRGEVKGYIDNPFVELPSKPDGKLDVGGAVGAGNLYVIKNLGMKEPYVGMVELVSGEIAEDITAYYAISEQVPTVCALGVLVNKDLTIACAGGFLLQLLPGALDEEIDLIESNINSMPAVTTLLAQGKTPEDMMHIALAGMQPNILDDQEVFYSCDCDEKRFETAIRALGKEELENLALENDDVEVKCQFCNKEYHYSASKLLNSL